MGTTKLHPHFIISDLEMEDEGVMRLTPKAQIVGSNKVLRTFF
jgi:hypothetical protein